MTNRNLALAAMRLGVTAQVALTKSAEEINTFRLRQKLAEAEINPTLDALIQAGLLTADRRKEAAAALADPVNALGRLRKLAEMVAQNKDALSVNGPGEPEPKNRKRASAPNRPAGPSVFDSANDGFVANL